MKSFDETTDLILLKLGWWLKAWGYLKWNDDGSAQGEEKKCAIGGVLRDWEECLRRIFSLPVEANEINHVQVQAIHKALEVTVAKDWVRYLNIL